MTKSKPSRSHSSGRKGLWLIAIFKLLKGLILLAVGIGALSLLHENVAAQVAGWIAVLGVDPNNYYIHKFIRTLWTVDDARLEAISAGTFFYSALMLTEGVGLALHKKWAEYFTIVATGSFMPLEIYELARKFSVTKIVGIAMNVAVVVYLAIGLRERKR